MLKIDIIIISYNRLDELKETIKNVLLYKKNINKIIIIDNASNDGTKEYLKSLNNENFEIFINNNNLGVAGGRNLGVKKSNADILVFIDDDAIFNVKKGNPFKIIQQEFEKNTKLGIIAFKIINYYSKKIQRHEFPFTNKKIDKNEKRLAAYYVGAGHAIKKEVFENCGLYPDDYFYGKEELDLSLRAINNGYEILYEPNIEVFHKQSPKGRMNNNEKWIQVYRNRLVISYKYYPFIYAMISNLLWFFKIIQITHSIKIPLKSYERFRKIKNNLKKNILNERAIKYIKDNYGRLFF